MRDLYKRFVHVAHDYPLPYSQLMQRIKQQFYEKRDVVEEEELLRCVHYGRYMVKEMIATIQLKKYRALRKIYIDEDNDTGTATTTEANGKDDMRTN